MKFSIFLDYLKEIFLNPLSHIVEIIFLLALLLLLGMILSEIFRVLDSWFLPKQSGVGIVISKNYSPAGMTPITNTVNNITTTTFIHRSESWSIVVELEGESDSITVNEEFYDKIKINQPVNIKFVRGRLSQSFYLKEIEG